MISKKIIKKMSNIRPTGTTTVNQPTATLRPSGTTNTTQPATATNYRPATTTVPTGVTNYSNNTTNYRPAQGTTTTTTNSYGLGGDPERRLNADSARKLARMVFLKYDDNDSGFMNSQEAANLITDLYASVNMEYTATPEEGVQFMKANDSDYNLQYPFVS